MLYINEWLPNPVGNDAMGEFIELYNSGPAAVPLAGYALGTGAKKTFNLDGYAIAPHRYLMLTHAQTKLSLKNTDGEVLLYGPDGGVIDEAAFAGAAPEGKSFSRVDYSAAPIGHFAFTYPTPGAANRTIDTAVVASRYPYGVPLSPQPAPGAIALMAFVAGTTLALFFFYVIRKNRTLSDFFFPRDADARG